MDWPDGQSRVVDTSSWLRASRVGGQGVPAEGAALDETLGRSSLQIKISAAERRATCECASLDSEGAESLALPYSAQGSEWGGDILLDGQVGEKDADLWSTHCGRVTYAVKWM